MYPVQRGLYNHRSTMNQFAKPGQQFMNMDPYPFTNANLTDLSPKLSNQTNGEMYQYNDMGDDYLHQDLSNKEDSSLNNMSTKKPLSKAERRAEHNAIERARRETLNSKFQSLAQVLPNLINYRRPSKSQIIEKALDWVKQSLSREERYRYQILQLQRENKRFLSQLMPQQQQENIPPTGIATASDTTPSAAPAILRHSVSTPNISSTNNGPSALAPPQMYASFSATTSTDYKNGWSNNNHHMTPPPIQQQHQQQLTTSFSSCPEDLIMTTPNSKQGFVSPRSDDEDNISSSGNEDELNYRTSSSANPSPPDHNLQQFDHRQQCIIAATEMYSVTGFPVSAAEAQYNSALLNAHWNQQAKYSTHMVNSGGNMIVDSGLVGIRSPATPSILS